MASLLAASNILDTKRRRDEHGGEKDFGTECGGLQDCGRR
jgi:hypothetical protein